jgi:hypothetical protein
MKKGVIVSSAVDIANKRALWTYIKAISTHHGGDGDEWLKEYGAEVVKAHGAYAALKCFEDIHETLFRYSSKIIKRDI